MSEVKGEKGQPREIQGGRSELEVDVTFSKLLFHGGSICSLARFIRLFICLRKALLPVVLNIFSSVKC